jgi:perosamine synthetase
VFADVDRHSWCVTAADVERRLSPRTKAIVAVHTYGNVCAMNEIVELAERRGIPVIEDAAEAFASRYRGTMAGAIALVGTFSFHATKTITTGEGGMVVTRDDALHDKMLLYRSHGTSRLRYWHEVAGHNFRLTNMQAAMGCAQLEQIGRIIVERKRMFDTYRRCLGQTSGIAMQRFSAEVDAVPWVVAVELDSAAFPQGRDAVMKELGEAGIETRPGFYTPTRMRHLYVADTLPCADAVSDWVIALPSFPSLRDDQIELICSELERSRR